jgi:hypothetical protein
MDYRRLPAIEECALMTDAPTAYPLQWPFGRPRNQTRNSGGFKSMREGWANPITLAIARERLERQLEMLGAAGPILSTNVELTLSGVPRSGRPEPSDPGVALYFRLAGKPMVLACDRYSSVAQNVAALAAHIEATRRIDRYGVATMEEMFAGFLALPAPIVVNDWRAALGNPRTRAEAEAAWKERMKSAYPDRPGGSHAEAAKLNAAIEAARRELI